MPRSTRSIHTRRPSLDSIRQQLAGLSPDERTDFVESKLAELLGPAFEGLTGAFSAGVVNAIMDGGTHRTILAKLGEILVADEEALASERAADKRRRAAAQAAVTRRRNGTA
jgi:hypothetical protein